jgi:hypothetical protein
MHNAASARGSKGGTPTADDSTKSLQFSASLNGIAAKRLKP